MCSGRFVANLETMQQLLTNCRNTSRLLGGIMAANRWFLKILGMQADI
jgi:hypothetical protein